MNAAIDHSPEVLTSTDGGKNWIKGPNCSERIQVEALARGYQEFVSHRSRKHEYPHGIIVRWRGEIVTGRVCRDRRCDGSGWVDLKICSCRGVKS